MFLRGSNAQKWNNEMAAKPIELAKSRITSSLSSMQLSLQSELDFITAKLSKTEKRVLSMLEEQVKADEEKVKIGIM